MREGFVALLDVLGFSALVRDAGEAGIQRYLGCLQRATQPTNVNYVVFSDSIVLSAKGDTPESFMAVAGACSQLFSDLLSQDIALRGAIAFGGFVREAFAESVFVAGRAVIDAYQFEQAQDWVGIMIAPSALSRVQDLHVRCHLEDNTHTTAEGLKNLTPRLRWAAFIQPCASIPFHASTPFDSPSFDGFAVVPTSGQPEPAALRDSTQQAIERLKWLRAIAPSPASQRKYQQTLNWLNQINYLWQRVAWSQEQAVAHP